MQNAQPSESSSADVSADAGGNNLPVVPDAMPKQEAVIDPDKKDEKAGDQEAEENFPEGVERAPVDDPLDGVGEVAPPGGAAVFPDEPEQEAGQEGVVAMPAVVLAADMSEPEEDENEEVSDAEDDRPEGQADPAVAEVEAHVLAAENDEAAVEDAEDVLQGDTAQMPDAQQIIQMQDERIAELEAINAVQVAEMARQAAENAAQAARIAQLEGLLRGFMLSAQAMLSPSPFSPQPSVQIVPVVVANDREEKHAGEFQIVEPVSLSSGVPVAVPVLQPSAPVPAPQPSSAAGYSPNSPRFLVTPRAAQLSEAVGSQVLVVERREGGELTVSSSSVSS